MTPYDKIRAHYEFLTPLILKRSQRHPSAWEEPYCPSIDWNDIFTPIEFETWHAIRNNGRIPLYPQFPILDYFADFANPFLKVIVECDGAEFHLDKKKDNDRDFSLKKEGWKVYRISGSDCWRVPSYKYYDLVYHYEEERLGILNDFYNDTIDGLIRALSIVYCKGGCYKDKYVDERVIANECLNKRLSKPVEHWININNTPSTGKTSG